ncbi:MAG: type I methionyl aminopeptidase [Campylobacterales bacterium]|nr:type I methionyl aminopeptidase [Campylobacterales bacterium]
MAIAIRKPDEIKKLAKAAELVAKTLNHLEKNIKEGMNLEQIDAMGEEYIRSFDAIPAFKGLYGFKGSVCTSLNQVVIHGVPIKETVIKSGDILGLDIGVKLDGYYGDAAITMPIGEISKEDQSLIACSKDVLYEAINQIKEGMRFKELSSILEQSIISRGYIPLREYCGHGIGSKPHDEPNIPNYIEGKANQGPKIKNGMVFCIEPMVCQKSGKPLLLDDEWSVISEDGLNTSHYEHQVAIIDGKAVILSEIGSALSVS